MVGLRAERNLRKDAERSLGVPRGVDIGELVMMLFGCFILKERVNPVYYLYISSFLEKSRRNAPANFV